MPRALFEKTGKSVWISHLDLMRLFQRAFKRSGLKLTHTQGFNPRPSVSIALPLSVGVDSVCELLDFDLEGEPVTCDEICDRLNENLIEGVKVLQVYEGGRKMRELALLRCTVTLSYDQGVPADAVDKIRALLSQQTLIVPKKTKSAIQDVDIAPMIREVAAVQTDATTVTLHGLICCQNPSLNPMQLAAAVNVYHPELIADFVKCSRLELYDSSMNIFR